jgi:hypothetical protein
MQKHFFVSENIVGEMMKIVEAFRKSSKRPGNGRRASEDLLRDEDNLLDAGDNCRSFKETILGVLPALCDSAVSFFNIIPTIQPGIQCISVRSANLHPQTAFHTLFADRPLQDGPN